MHGEETVVNGRSSSGGLLLREEAWWRCCSEVGVRCGALASLHKDEGKQRYCIAATSEVYGRVIMIWHMALLEYGQFAPRRRTASFTSYLQLLCWISVGFLSCLDCVSLGEYGLRGVIHK